MLSVLGAGGVRERLYAVGAGAGKGTGREPAAVATAVLLWPPEVAALDVRSVRGLSCPRVPLRDRHPELHRPAAAQYER